jgi:hypothetical protein
VKVNVEKLREFVIRHLPAIVYFGAPIWLTAMLWMVLLIDYLIHGTPQW